MSVVNDYKWGNTVPWWNSSSYWESPLGPEPSEILNILLCLGYPNPVERAMVARAIASRWAWMAPTMPTTISTLTYHGNGNTYHGNGNGGNY